MNKSFLTIYCSVACTLAHAPNLCLASQSDKVLTKRLDAREAKFQHAAFTWSVGYKEIDDVLSSDEIVKRQEQRNQSAAKYRKQGLKNEVLVWERVEADMEHDVSPTKSLRYVSTTNWTLQRDGDRTLIAGIRALNGSEANTAQYYRQFYQDNSVVLFTDAQMIAGVKTPDENPCAYASSGESTRYRSLTSRGLEIMPEHFAVLAGFNPFRMYGAQWTFVKKMPDRLIFSSHIAQVNGQPIDILLTLSSSHDDAPSEIVVSAGHELFKAVVNKFQQFNGDWLASDVKTYLVMDYVRKYQDWRLSDVHATQPFEVNYNGGAVQDYRLLGPDTTDTTPLSWIPPAQWANIVKYQWPGHFPTIAELTELRDHKSNFSMQY